MLAELYQDIILDHHKRPRNFRILDQPSSSAEGLNPLCGDEVRVYVSLKGDVLEDISFQGQGCALSKASASLMTVRLKHKTLREARADIDSICMLLTQEEEPDASTLEHCGDLGALAGIRKFPARIKCATLPWHALRQALDEARENNAPEA